MDGQWVRESPALTGVASGPYTLERVEVAVCRQGDGSCWDGTRWVGGEVWLRATGTTNWTFSSLPPLEPGGYVAQARARDSQGQVDGVPAAVSFHMAADVVFLPLVPRD